MMFYFFLQCYSDELNMPGADPPPILLQKQDIIFGNLLRIYDFHKKWVKLSLNTKNAYNQMDILKFQNSFNSVNQLTENELTLPLQNTFFHSMQINIRKMSCLQSKKELFRC